MSPRSVVAALKMDLKAFSRIAGGGVVPLHFDANQKNNLSLSSLAAEICGRPGISGVTISSPHCRPDFLPVFPPRILNTPLSEHASGTADKPADTTLQGKHVRRLKTNQRANNRAKVVDHNESHTTPNISEPQRTVQMFSGDATARRCKPAPSATPIRRLLPSLDRSHPFQAHA